MNTQPRPTSPVFSARCIDRRHTTLHGIHGAASRWTPATRCFANTSLRLRVESTTRQSSRRGNGCVRRRPGRCAAVWIHGDLHPGNLLVRDGRLSGVLDFGDVTAGDPATDLSVGWMLLSGLRAIRRSAT